MTRGLWLWFSFAGSIASFALGLANWANGREQVVQATKSYEQAKEQYAVAKAQFQSAFKPLINFDRGRILFPGGRVHEEMLGPSSLLFARR